MIKTFQDKIDFQKDPDNLSKWADRWEMKFNHSKYQVIGINQTRQLLENVLNIMKFGGTAI